MHSRVSVSSLQEMKYCFQCDTYLSCCQGQIHMERFPSRLRDSRQISVFGKCLCCTQLVVPMISKDNPRHIEVILTTIQLSYTKCHGKIHPRGLRYTTCWMGDCVTFLVQYGLFPFLSHPDSQLWYWPSLPFTSYFFLFSDTLTPLLPLSCLSHSYQICSFRSWGGSEWNIQKPLHLWSNSETPCPPWSICHHAECQEVSLGLTSGHSSAWHSEREKERNSERRRKRKSGAEGEWTWQRPWNTSVPLSRARGLRGPAVSTSH